MSAGSWTRLLNATLIHALLISLEISSEASSQADAEDFDSASPFMYHCSCASGVAAKVAQDLETTRMVSCRKPTHPQPKPVAPLTSRNKFSGLELDD
jgi:hypothetical protein